MSDIQVGDVIKVSLPQQNSQGIEQEGFRRAVVVGLPSTLGSLRFPILVVVPFTSNKSGYDWARANPSAYPLYPAGTAGLKEDSIALVDQVRALDPSRIGRRVGSLTSEQFAPIDSALRRLFVH